MPILSPKRQVTLPKALCDRLRIQPGDDLEFLEHHGRITSFAKAKGSSAAVLCRIANHDCLPNEKADLVDALVVNKAKITAQHRNEPYHGTYTCDRAALALDGTPAP